MVTQIRQSSAEETQGQAYATYTSLAELTKCWTPINASDRLLRVAPALSAIELTVQLLVHTVGGQGNSSAYDTSSPCFFSQMNVTLTRLPVEDNCDVDDVVDLLSAQLQLVRGLLDMDIDRTSYKTDYNLTQSPSKASFSQSSILSPLLDRIQTLARSHVTSLPFGLGIFMTSHSEYLSYDDIVLPHALAKTTQHEHEQSSTIQLQIAEAWLCAMDRHLDAAQANFFTSDAASSPFKSMTKRYRWCRRVWLFLDSLVGSLVSSPSTPRLGHSLQLRHLVNRISTIFPLQSSPTSSSLVIDGAFNPANLKHLLHLLHHVDPSQIVSSMQAELASLFQATNSPLATDVAQLVTTARQLDQAMRRFFFTYDQLLCTAEKWMDTTTRRFICVDTAQTQPLDSSPFRGAFARSLARHPPNTLHFSTYGMGLAPDVALTSVQQTHAFLAGELNELWPHYFQHDLPHAERIILQSLGLDAANQSLRYHVNFGANVHEFLLRLFSCVRPGASPLDIVTSDAEFVSLTRQLKAWGSDTVTVHTVPLCPFHTFGTRLRAKVAAVVPPLVHVSVVYSNTQYRFPDADIAALVADLPPKTLCILDAAQAVENVPMQLPMSPSLVVVGSGIKHATAGPGLGFIAFPRIDSQPPLWTPTNTGWIAHLGSMTAPPDCPVEYTPELAFYGGTPGNHYAVRQLNDVHSFYASQGWTLQQRHAYVLGLQQLFLHRLGGAIDTTAARGKRDADSANYSNALVLRHTHAKTLHHALATPTRDRATVFHSDVRVLTSLRLGFGLHHIASEVLALADAIVTAWQSLATDEKLVLVV
ncbi:Aste57867_23498 [Aphanomyces stellatus]|uniref:Aste57867_23498 protein n=1 Tax=Aphanomyces stellatus TaxID=120398 RepID=A0A485LPQ4_9STRA|nr:hypothetical protein As57867_023427 [Aphanomyces stellatus]VFU00143.1 Aste57867_23498 [Aphanomyces stellatus]